MYSPRIDLAKARTRQGFVLDQMVQKGFARADQVAAAKGEAVTVAPEPTEHPELAPEVVDEVRRTLRNIVGPSAERGGYTVTTTIDPALEAARAPPCARNVDEYEKRHKLVPPADEGQGQARARARSLRGRPRPPGATRCSAW